MLKDSPRMRVARRSTRIFTGTKKKKDQKCIGPKRVIKSYSENFGDVAWVVVYRGWRPGVYQRLVASETDTGYMLLQEMCAEAIGQGQRDLPRPKGVSGTITASLENVYGRHPESWHALSFHTW